MPEEDTTAENTTDSADSDAAADVTPPETNGWWQFGSKDEATEWANKIVENRLSRERKKTEPIVVEHATLKAEVERLKPLEDATKTDAQRWEAEKSTFVAELEELRSFKSSAERANLVRDIAEDKGLPAKLVKWVSGNDADTITESVEELLNDLSEVGQSPKKPAQRKPKETDGDEPGSKGSGGGGGGDDDGFSVDNLLKKVREQRGTTYAH